MSHKFEFFRAGGFDQVRVASGDDVASLADLDPKLWVAIACPAKHLELDAHTLALLDGDNDGRIRVPDVVAAANWVSTLLNDPDELFSGATALPLESIDVSTDEGKRLRASAKRILKNLDKGDAKEITTAETLDTAAIFAKTLFNGDGIVPPESAEEDTATADTLRDIIKCYGAEKDKSTKDGVSRAKAETFFKEADAHLAWWATGEGDPKVLPLGEDTPGAYEAYQAVRAKAEDFFARCALAAMDPRASDGLNVRDAEIASMATVALHTASGELAKLPIARIEKGRLLPLEEGLNPAFAPAVAAFRKKCVTPLIGERKELSADDLAAIGEKLAGHAAWLATKPKSPVDALPIARLKAIVDAGAKEKIEALIAKDEAVKPEAESIAAVDKLVHYYRDLALFIRNFVSFEDFYARRDKAAFQAGTLYLDGRSFELCLRVDDVGKHATLAALSMACLLYCECVRDGGKERMSIVAAVTNGDSDFLLVGRNGVFYDRKGRDWDATITRIVEQPISLRQAFWAPYKRASRFLTSQIEKFAGEKSAQSNAMLETAATIQTADPAAPPPPPAPAAQPTFDVGRFAGVFAAIGLAIGAIGTAAAAVVTGFLELYWWQMPLALLGIVLVISGPSVLLASLKLRERNLAPILDASGWAINTRARINIPFGAALTSLAVLPPGSKRLLTDPYAEKKRPWKTYIVIALLVGGTVYATRAQLIEWARPWVREVPVVKHWFAEEEDLVVPGEGPTSRSADGTNDPDRQREEPTETNRRRARGGGR
jgi:hypothetical protein